jgi:chromosome segregation ATPase
MEKENAVLQSKEEIIKTIPLWKDYKELSNQHCKLQAAHETLKRDYMAMELMREYLQAGISSQKTTIEKLSGTSNSPFREDSNNYRALIESRTQEIQEMLCEYDETCKTLASKKERNANLLTQAKCCEDILATLQSAIGQSSLKLGLLCAGQKEQEIKYKNMRAFLGWEEQGLIDLKVQCSELEKDITTISLESEELDLLNSLMKRTAKELNEEIDQTNKCLREKTERCLELEAQLQNCLSVESVNFYMEDESTPKTNMKVSERVWFEN